MERPGAADGGQRNRQANEFGASSETWCDQVQPEAAMRQAPSLWPRFKRVGGRASIRSKSSGGGSSGSANCSSNSSGRSGRSSLTPRWQQPGVVMSTLARVHTADVGQTQRSKCQHSAAPRYMEQQWGEQRTLVAADAARAGSEIYRVPRRPEFVRAAPDMHTLQVSTDEHLDFAAALPAASLTHHDCDPNGDLHVTSDAVVFTARRDIAPGEILSFDYNTTEWRMAAPFACRCGSAGCVGTVGGFELLPLERRAAIAPRCSPVVRELAIEHGLWPLHIDAALPHGPTAAAGPTDRARM